MSPIPRSPTDPVPASGQDVYEAEMRHLGADGGTPTVLFTPWEDISPRLRKARETALEPLFTARDASDRVIKRLLDGWEPVIWDDGYLSWQRDAVFVSMQPDEAALFERLRGES